MLSPQGDQIRPEINCSNAQEKGVTVIIADYDSCFKPFFTKGKHPGQYILSEKASVFLKGTTTDDIKKKFADNPNVASALIKFKAIIDTIPEGDEVVLFCGSARQSVYSDKLLAEKNDNGFCFKNYDTLCKKLGWNLNMLLLDDIDHKRNPGETMKEFLSAYDNKDWEKIKKITKKPKLRSHLIKTPIMKNIVTHIGESDFFKGKRVNMHFFDDEDEVLQNLSNSFYLEKDYYNMPSNIKSIKFHHFNPHKGLCKSYEMYNEIRKNASSLTKTKHLLSTDLPNKNQNKHISNDEVKYDNTQHTNNQDRVEDYIFNRFYTKEQRESAECQAEIESLANLATQETERLTAEIQSLYKIFHKRLKADTEATKEEYQNKINKKMNKKLKAAENESEKEEITTHYNNLKEGIVSSIDKDHKDFRNKVKKNIRDIIRSYNKEITEDIAWAVSQKNAQFFRDFKVGNYAPYCFLRNLKHTLVNIKKRFPSDQHLKAYSSLERNEFYSNYIEKNKYFESYFFQSQPTELLKEVSLLCARLLYNIGLTKLSNILLKGFKTSNLVYRSKKKLTQDRNANNSFREPFSIREYRERYLESYLNTKDWTKKNNTKTILTKTNRKKSLTNSTIEADRNSSDAQVTDIFKTESPMPTNDSTSVLPNGQTVSLSHK